MRDNGDSARSERRHHANRLKHKRRHYWGYDRSRSRSGPDGPPLPPETISASRLGQLLHTPQLCSCAGCGNPRRHAWFKGERLTVQERRYDEQYKEQVEELDECTSDARSGEDSV